MALLQQGNLRNSIDLPAGESPRHSVMSSQRQAEQRDSQVIRQNMLQALYAGDTSSGDEDDDDDTTVGKQGHVTATTVNGGGGSHDDYIDYTERDIGITVADAAAMGMMASSV